MKMPLPEPNKEEKQAQFISRCMSNDTMKKDFPDQTQRTGVCFSQWKKARGENMEQENVKRDEQGRLIVAENVHVVFTGQITKGDEE